MMDAGIAAQFYSKSAGIPTADHVKNMNMAQIEKVSQDFESLFIGMMLEHMFTDSVGDHAFGDKETADVYKGMVTEQYGKEIARAGGIGIAGYVKTELLRLQEQESNV